MRRQSSNSGEALATLPEGQRATLICTGPHGVSTLEKFAGERDLVFDAPVQADGGGLAEDEIAQRGHKIGLAEHGELDAGAAFLHLHGDAIDVPCAGGEEQLADIAEQLRAGVVDDGFDDGDGFGWLGRLTLAFRRREGGADSARRACRGRLRRSRMSGMRIAGSGS